MPTYTVHQAKTNLSELIRRVEAGEEVIIARGDKPVVVLKDIKKEPRIKRPILGRGSMKGKYPVPEDRVFFGPFTEEEQVEMFGREYVDLMKEMK